MISARLKATDLLLCFALIACGDATLPSTTQVAEVEHSTPIVAPVTDRFLDSAAVETFVADRKLNDNRAGELRRFYGSRNYQYAWLDGNGLVEQGRIFWNLHNSYVNYSKDSSFYNQQWILAGHASPAFAANDLDTNYHHPRPGKQGAQRQKHSCVQVKPITKNLIR